MKSTYRALASVCLVIAVVTAITAGLGVFGREGDSTSVAVSARGEQIEYVVSGVYAFNAERIVAEGVGWDVVTLFVAVPLLLLTLPGILRGALKSRILALGVLSYLLYQYMMYAMSWAFGPLFPIFIVLYASAGATIVWLVSTIDRTTLPVSISSQFPRKGMAGFCLIVAVLLVGMWSMRIARGLSGDLEGAGLLGMTTLVVQAMDLGIIVPLALATAVLVWRRCPWGYLLASVFSIKGVTMAGAICAMLISAALVEGSLEIGSFMVFGALTIAAGVFAWRVFGSMPSNSTTDTAKSI